jgi:hypothetical protein
LASTAPVGAATPGVGPGSDDTLLGLFGAKAPDPSCVIHPILPKWAHSPEPSDRSAQAGLLESWCYILQIKANPAG